MTGLRNPCAPLDKIRGLMAATLDRDVGGNFVRKTGNHGCRGERGEVRPGEPIRIEPPPLPHRPLPAV